MFGRGRRQDPGQRYMGHPRRGEEGMRRSLYRTWQQRLRTRQSHDSKRGHCFKKEYMAILKMDDC